MGQRKYPPLTPSEVVDILIALGFVRRGQVGSHAQYFKAANGRRPTSLVTVDIHYDQFDNDLMKSMIRQSNYSREEFYGATKPTARKAGVAMITVKS